MSSHILDPFRKLFQVARAALAPRAARAERCPITEWAEGAPQPLPVDTEVLTYREFLARQAARRKGSV